MPLTILGTICFTVRTFFIAEVTKTAGPFTALYLSVGVIIYSGAFFIFKACKNKFLVAGGSFHIDLNLVRGGKLLRPNTVGLLIFCILYFLAQNMTYLTLWTSLLADMNIGIVSVLWSITPLIVAVFEYVIYRFKLSRNYLIGMFMMVVSAVVLSLNTLILESKKG